MIEALFVYQHEMTDRMWEATLAGFVAEASDPEEILMALEEDEDQ